MIVQKLKKDFFLNFLNYLVDFARQAVPLRGDDAGGRERERCVNIERNRENARHHVARSFMESGGEGRKKRSLL